MGEVLPAPFSLRLYLQKFYHTASFLMPSTLVLDHI